MFVNKFIFGNLSELSVQVALLVISTHSSILTSE